MVSSSKQAPKKKIFFAGSAVWQRHWRACVEAFLQTFIDNGSPVSSESYRKTLLRFFRDPNKHPLSYVTEDVLQFISKLTPDGTPPKARTRNANLVRVRSFYHFASRYKVKLHGKIRPLCPPGQSPCDDIKTVKEPHVRHVWTKEQLSRFFRAIPRDTELGLRDYALFLTYFWTARRLTEVADLLWRDIETNHVFSDGHVGILYRWRGKGRAGEEKSAELHPAAWAAIEQYLRFSGRLATIKPDDGLFSTTRLVRGKQNTRPISTEQIDDRIRKILKRAGLSGSVHWFRHTRAYESWRNGAKEMDVMKLLDHKDLGTTHIYLIGMEEDTDPTAQALAGWSF